MSEPTIEEAFEDEFEQIVECPDTFTKADLSVMFQRGAKWMRAAAVEAAWSEVTECGGDDCRRAVDAIVGRIQRLGEHQSEGGTG